MNVFINNNGNVVIEEFDLNVDYKYVSPLDDENYFSFEVTRSDAPLIDLARTILEYLEVDCLEFRCECGLVKIDIHNILNNTIHLISLNLSVNIKEIKDSIAYISMCEILYKKLSDEYKNNLN